MASNLRAPVRRFAAASRWSRDRRAASAGRSLAGSPAQARRSSSTGGDAAQVEAAVAALVASGGAAHGASFDVTDQAAVSAGVAKIEAEIGPIDIFVNNAGIQRRGPLEDFPEETWRELMRANLDSVVLRRPGGRARDDPAQERPDHQYLLGAERTRPAPTSRLTPPRRAR